MAIIKILKPSKDIKGEPVEYGVEIIGKEEESEQLIKEKFENLKKELKNDILCGHSEYGVFIHSSNSGERLILEAAYLYKKYALLTIKEIARKQDLEIQEEETP